MKKVLHILLYIIILLIITAAPLLAQDEIIQDVRVAVFPLWYSEEDETFGPVLSGVVQSTIQWVLRLIEGYVLVETDEYPAGQNDLADYGKKNDLNNIIYGRVDQSNGEYSVSLLLYDCEKDRIEVIKQDSVTSALEIFDLADSLSIELLEQFLGRKLEFGSMAFYPAGDGPGHYEVFINDTYFGTSIDSISTFLTGQYNLTIQQVNDRDRLTVFDAALTVEKDGMAIIDFPMHHYGYLTVKKRGPNIEHTVLVNGEATIPEYNETVPVPVGTYIYKLTEISHMNTSFLVQEETVEITEGEESEITLEPRTLGLGLELIPEGALGDFTVSVNGIEYQQNVRILPVLPAGPVRIVITQVFPAETAVVFDGTVNLKENETKQLAFTLYNSPEEVETAKSSVLNLSAELQTFAGSYVSAGVNILVLDNRLGGSLLVGATSTNGNFVLTGTAKVHGVLFGSRLLSPYAGAALFLGTDFTDTTVRLGPNIGLSWNTGNRYVSSVFIENGLFYDFTVSENPKIFYMFAVGLRLF